MANTLKLGNGKWATGKDTLLSFSDTNNNYKPLPFSFSRASSGTVVNKDGLIETVGSGEPRIDFKDNTKGALLLEPSRSNLVTYSSIFSIWTQVNGASTSDTTDVISPDGTLNAELLVSGGNGNVQGIYKNISFLNATTYTMSVFAKKKEISFIQLQGGGAGWGGNTFANFDLENGIVGNIGSGAISSSIENYGNGWYRCSFTATKTASGGNLSIDLINSATDGRDTSYNGNIGDGVYIYGAQAEEGSYATSYIPTSGSAVTRVQETSANLTNSINNFGTSNFSLFIESYIKEGYNARVKKMQSWTTRGYAFYLNAYGLRGRVYGDSQIDTSYVGIGSVINNSKNKALMVVDRVLNTITIYSNGVNVHSESIASIAGDSLDNTAPLQFQRAINIEAGLINDFKIYNTALTNAEAIALTTT